MISNNKTYKEMLEFARKNDISVTDLLVAEEVESKFYDANEEEFEKICEVVENAYLKSDSIEVWAIACALKELADDYEEENDGKKLDFNEVDKWTLLDKASELSF